MVNGFAINGISTVKIKTYTRIVLLIKTTKKYSILMKAKHQKAEVVVRGIPISTPENNTDMRKRLNRIDGRVAKENTEDYLTCKYN
jgi:hypothetical protein